MIKDNEMIDLFFNEIMQNAKTVEMAKPDMTRFAILFSLSPPSTLSTKDVMMPPSFGDSSLNASL